jgi:hypothetical protein
VWKSTNLKIPNYAVSLGTDIDFYPAYRFRNTPELISLAPILPLHALRNLEAVHNVRHFSRWIKESLLTANSPML